MTSKSVPQSSGRGDYVVTRAELQEHLTEQLAFLELSADGYDRGFEAEAKRLAVVLRVLFHNNPKSGSRSLLSQLGEDQREFVDTARPHEPSNLAAHAGLVEIVSGTPTGWRAYPVLDDDTGSTLETPFDVWWSATILADLQRRLISRKELVLTAANQDGGVHVDPKLDRTYADLSKNNSLGWQTGSPERGWRTIGGVERASLRQIAHEVLRTLRPDYRKIREDTGQQGVVIRTVSLTGGER